MSIINDYLSFLFEQDPREETKAVMYNSKLYSILGGIKVDLPTFNMFRTITIAFQNNLKGCERFQDLENQLCVVNAKLNFLRRETDIMRRGDRLCEVQKDPVQCREKIRDKVLKFNEQIKKLVQKVSEIRREMVIRKNKEAEEKRKGERTRGLNVPRQVTVG
jgi:hypothetical protein